MKKIGLIYWNPTNVYFINEIVLFENKYYKSLKSDNKPTEEDNYTPIMPIYWVEVELSKWIPISFGIQVC
jgi:hypothetical protein